MKRLRVLRHDPTEGWVTVHLGGLTGLPDGVRFFRGEQQLFPRLFEEDGEEFLLTPEPDEPLYGRL